MNKNKGFTLLEILVVIAIIAIIIAFSISNFVGARQRARDIRKKSELQQMKNALRLYYNDYNTYPGPSANAAVNDINGCGIDRNPPPLDSCLSSSCGSNGIAEFAAGPNGCDNVYMKQLPLISDYAWSYRSVKNGDDFCLWTQLENISDGEINKSEAKCNLACVGVVGVGSYVVCAD